MLYLLLGDPVEHSISPKLYKAAFGWTGLDHDYQARRAANAAEALGHLQDRQVAGASVTIPLKSALIESMDELDPLVKLAGALNTIVKRDGRLCGWNTDVAGLLAALGSYREELAGRSAAVLGAGGAARACLVSLDRLGLGRALVLARRDEAAAALCRDLGGRLSIELEPGRLGSQSAAQELGRAALVCNCTPLGMWPLVDAAPIDPELIAPGAVVFDAVYRPRATRLLKLSRARGCRIVDGAAMFLHQALQQFELLTGVKPPIERMSALVDRLLDENRDDR